MGCPRNAKVIGHVTTMEPRRKLEIDTLTDGIPLRLEERVDHGGEGGPPGVHRGHSIIRLLLRCFKVVGPVPILGRLTYWIEK